MKRRIALITTIVAVSALAIVPLIQAAPGHGQRGMGAHGAGIFGHLQRVKAELGLTDQQVAEIRGIFAQVREQNAPYREQMKGGFRGVAQTLLNDPNDLTAAQALIDQQAAAERAMKANMLTATSRALNVLTAEQRAKLGELLEQRMERHRGRGRR